jgi:predicted methyltransferase
VLKIPCDYDVHFKNRKKFKNKSGGIVVIYKEYLSNYFKILDSDSDFVQWIEITKNISLLNENFVLGCTHIPPEFSKYSSEESFIEIEVNFINF